MKQGRFCIITFPLTILYRYFPISMQVFFKSSVKTIRFNTREGFWVQRGAHGGRSSVLERCGVEGWLRPIFTTLLHRQLSLVPIVLFMHPACAAVTPLNSAASGVSSGFEMGPLSRIWSMTASTLVSQPSISEIPPYPCQDMPAYPPPSIKFLPPGRFSHRKWFHLKSVS